MEGPLGWVVSEVITVLNQMAQGPWGWRGGQDWAGGHSNSRCFCTRWRIHQGEEAAADDVGARGQAPQQEPCEQGARRGRPIPGRPVGHTFCCPGGGSAPCGNEVCSKPHVLPPAHLGTRYGAQAQVIIALVAAEARCPLCLGPQPRGDGGHSLRGAAPAPRASLGRWAPWGHPTGLRSQVRGGHLRAHT